MKKDPYKLRAVALLVALGFVGGMFVQYQAPGNFVMASHKAEKKPKGQVAGNADAFIGEEAAPKDASSDGPAPSEAAEAEAADQKKREEEARKAEEAQKKADAAERQEPLPPEEITPPTLWRYAAIAAVVDNTLEITGPKGEKRYVYFAPRGVVGEFSGDSIEVRLWTRDDDRLCRSLGGDKRECFYLSVHLSEQLQKGSIKTLPERIEALKVGATVGVVKGVGAQDVKLMRGNIRGLPGYVPLLEGKPAPEWTQDPVAGARSFVGAILLRQSRDDDRAATFFAPTGQVFEVSRLARHTVSLRIGAWRRQGDLVCREIKPEAEQAGARTEDCAHARMADGRVEFAEAGPSWRSFFRTPWPDEEPATGPAVSGPASPTGEVVLGSRGRKTSEGSFTDLR